MSISHNFFLVSQIFFPQIIHHQIHFIASRPSRCKLLRPIATYSILPLTLSTAVFSEPSKSAKCLQYPKSIRLKCFTYNWTQCLGWYFPFKLQFLLPRYGLQWLAHALHVRLHAGCDEECPGRDGVDLGVGPVQDGLAFHHACVCRQDDVVVVARHQHCAVVVDVVLPFRSVFVNWLKFCSDQ